MSHPGGEQPPTIAKPDELLALHGMLHAAAFAVVEASDGEIRILV